MTGQTTLEDAGCRFGDTLAVDNVTMSLPAGRLIGLVGPSGSGKTTIVRLLTGALEPTSGTVTTLGAEPRRLPRATRRRLGYMPQHFSLYPDLTARENVDFVASLFGMLGRERGRRTREALELVQLWDARDRRAGRLSGGMLRRLELAAALVHEPELLFLDEPTAGLDPILRTVTWDELRRLRDEGRTLLVTTQYVGEAEECDIVALLVEGRLVAFDSPAALRASAIGGEVLDLTTARPVDPGTLLRVDAITRAERTGATTWRITVDSAARALPSVVESLGAEGAEVIEAQTFTPDFDEVFVELVTRARAGRAAGDPIADQP